MKILILTLGAVAFVLELALVFIVIVEHYI
jgi:hypothetical protein